MYAPEYPLSYQGESTEHIIYDDWCRIVGEIPPLAERYGRVWIGHWCVVEVYGDDIRVIVPRSMLAARKQ